MSRPSMAVGASPPPAPLPVGLFYFRRFLLVAMLMMCILGCQRVPVLEIVVWSAFKDQELELLKKEGAAFAAREGIPVRVVRVP
ncbi:MAG: hypothetical protein FJX76_22125, partial [Armatimonadetes bacterium]|nr:hypothetical protein [Armatimonadota bacterium]